MAIIMSEKIKLGIIGVGSIAAEHIKGYLKNPNVEIYAFCDISEKQLSLMGEKYGITRLFTQAEDLLSIPEIDAVSVCTWNSAHAAVSIAALNAGKHVLCEKPMAISAEEGLLMKEAADRNQKTLMIGFVRRYGNDCKILKDFMKIDYFGDIYYAKVRYLRKLGNPGGWFGDKSLSGGGPLIDLGVHVIDLIKYVLGNPKPVSVYGAAYQKLNSRKNIKEKECYKSSGAGDDDICNVEDLAVAMIRFENGTVLNVETSFSLNIEKDSGEIELFGTKGGAKIDPELKIFTEINDYLADIKLDAKTALNFEGLFENEINHFVDVVKNNAKCMSPAEDGVEMMKILDAIYESARIGHEVII